MTRCRGCGERGLVRVLDLGTVPPADFFPPADSPVRPEESSHELAMAMCDACALAQLADDDTMAEEPRGIEPQAVRDQAAAAVDTVAAAGWLTGRSVREFGSPHGGTWLPLLNSRGYHETSEPADVVLDSFGVMHDADQRQAFEVRASATRPDGVLLLQYHSLAAIVRYGQWNALRHGHFAYYSLSSLQTLLDAVGMSVASAWDFDLYGGTMLLAAVHGRGRGDESVERFAAAEQALDVATPAGVAVLQQEADAHAISLRHWLVQEAASGRSVMAYGAASRAVALFARAGLDSTLVAGVADASPAKQGRRMPGTDIPIVSPDSLVAASPDRVLLTLPDLLPEVSSALPGFAGRWQLDTDFLPAAKRNPLTAGI